MEVLFNTFVVLFIVIDPVGLAPMFLGLTRGGTAAYQRKMAIRGTALASGMLLVFFFFGDALLAALGIGLPAFRIAGGALLFLLAIDMVFARQSGLRSTTTREQEEAEHKEDISVFPLAFPLIAARRAHHRAADVVELEGTGGVRRHVGRAAAGAGYDPAVLAVGRHSFEISRRDRHQRHQPAVRFGAGRPRRPVYFGWLAQRLGGLKHLQFQYQLAAAYVDGLDLAAERLF